MATESPIRILESDESKRWLPTMDSALFSSSFSTLADHDAASKVLKESVVLEEQSHLVPNRSGSAPPTIEGSIAAFQAFMDQRNSTLPRSLNDFSDCESEEQMRTDPAYIAYYYANVNLNPRLPPPLISWENRNLMQLMGGFDCKNSSLTKGSLATHKEEPEEATSPSKTSDDQDSFLHGAKITSLTQHNGSSIDLVEGSFTQAPSSASITAVKVGNDHEIDMASTTKQIFNMQEPCSISADTPSMSSSTNPSASTASNCRNLDLEDNVSTQSTIRSDVSVVESRLKLLDVSDGFMKKHDQMRHENIQLHDENRNLPCPSQNMTYQLPGIQAYAIPQEAYAVHQKLLPVHQSLLYNSGLVPPLYASTAAYVNSGNLFYPGVPQLGFPPSPQYASGESNVHSIFHPHFAGYLQDNAFPPPIDAYHRAAFFKQPMEALPREMNPYTSQLLRPPFGRPLQGQCFPPPYGDAQRSAFQCQLDALASQKDSSSIAGKELSHHAIEKMSVLPSTSVPHIRVTYGYPPNLEEPQFPAPSPALPRSSISRNIEQGLQNDPSPSLQSPKKAAVFSGLKGERGPESSDNTKRQYILELLKSGGSKTLELSGFSGQIVEFSTDQHGSRFIQQKLEHCGSEEKESVFKEVLLEASKLMTDVFGNYVVQKFFEHGTEEQKRKLGQQLTGQVLTLSLQMYGCRVIQKALEAIELDQKVELIKELDGHVIRCVHDQNGNHVIQKCIETIPTEKIKFIISSFAGQVATLSCHPYGCRVIQRVLEHCSDEQISNWIVDEILESTSTLTHDPYGNYVTQHVMEMGKPHQRSQIIDKLTGQFVKLSQHKFASNVVEKCIKHGNSSERDLIIEEIIGQPDNNKALLMMMKDQFANYVVQRIFEIGSEKQKDTLQNCIQLNLPALKKVAYAKHIVSRYEQLTEGSVQEMKRCEGMADSFPSTTE